MTENKKEGSLSAVSLQAEGISEPRRLEGIAEGGKERAVSLQAEGPTEPRRLEGIAEGEKESAAALRAWIREAHEKKRGRALPKGSAAVLIPVLIRDGSYHILYEIRAAKLHTQPGEICFPGGRIEEGEEPLEAAVREAMEELCIKRDQIEIIGKLDETIGPGTIPFFSFIGVLHGYEGSWSRAEVDAVFTVPLEWILSHDPVIYRVRLEHRLPEGFPYALIPGGKDYRWRSQHYPVPFYPDMEPDFTEGSASDGTDAPFSPCSREIRQAEGTEAESEERRPESLEATDPHPRPVLWGVTARVTYALAQLLREVPQKNH